MTDTRDKPIPAFVNNVPVVSRDDVSEFRGERWVTLVPAAEDDERLWEFSLDTGRVMRTR